MEDTSLTPQEVADILKIAKNTVYELIKRGDLNSYKVGKKIRIDLKDVEEYKNRSKNIKFTDHDKNSANSLKSINSANDKINHENRFVICGQDVLLDILAKHLELHTNGVQALRSYSGSYHGLLGLYLGNIQIATAHLWDGDTGQYNIPYVRRMLPGIPSVIIHLACRKLGFYVKNGNPKNIKDFSSLNRPDVTIVNREKGSGTRILLDEKLRCLGIDASELSGYYNERFSHLAIASTVARGEADVGIGNEKTSLQVSGIDFIPLQNERYELVIKKEDLNRPPFQAIIEIIRSNEFKAELLGLGGYDLSETGRIVSRL